MANKLRITRTGSDVGENRRVRRTLEALGLTKIGDSSIQPDNPAIRGMIEAVKNKVEVEELEESD